MNNELKQWIAHVEAVEPEMNVLVERLCHYDATVERVEKNIRGELPYCAEFSFTDAIVTIWFSLKDHQTNSDVVITNIATAPSTQRRCGFGRQAVQALLKWAQNNHLNEVRATQISRKENEKFWQKNGFVKCGEPNPCNDFICTFDST